MNDIERELERALQRRATDLGRPTGELHDVVVRANRRRSRRRGVAVLGSAAMIAVGALGITALGSGSDERPFAAGPTSTRSANGTGDPPPELQAAWRCTSQLDYFDYFQQGEEQALFFADCEQVTIDGGDEVFELPPPTTQFDPGGDDPVFAEAPGCTPGTGDGPECALTPTEQTITVVEGDTVATIARRYRLSVRTLASYNEWSAGPDHVVAVGDLVRIPPHPGAVGATSDVVSATTSPAAFDPGTPVVRGTVPTEQRYAIVAGDSLTSIASSFDITLDQLVAYNSFENGPHQLILPGDVIKIPPNALLGDPAGT